MQAKLEFLKTNALDLTVSKEAGARDIARLREEVSGGLACLPADPYTELGRHLARARRRGLAKETAFETSF